MDWKTPLVLATAFFVLLPGTFFSIGKPRRGQTAAIHAVLFGLVASVLQPILGIAKEGFQTDSSVNPIDVNEQISDELQAAFQDPKFVLEIMNGMLKEGPLSMFNIKPYKGIAGDLTKLGSPPPSSKPPYNTTKSSNRVTCEQVVDLMGYCPPNTCNVSVYTIPMNLRIDKTNEYNIVYEQNPSKGKIIQSSKCNDIMYVDSNNTIAGGISGDGMVMDIKDGIINIGSEVHYTEHPNYKVNGNVVPKSVDLAFRDTYVPPTPTTPTATPTAPATPSQPNPTPAKEEGLGAESIVGIVIGSLVGLALLIALLMYFMKPSSPS